MHDLLLLALSIAPGIAIVLFIYFSDKYEKEPWRLLAISFLYGAIGLFLSVIVSDFVNQFIVIHEENFMDEGKHAFSVAVVEEFIKFLFVRFILYRDKNFNEPFDGIVYTVTVGMGFATVENIIYVMNGTEATAILRMFTAVPAHGTFAILMGYFLGIAKFKHRKETQYSILALLTAILIHGVYDYFLFISFVPGIWVMAFICLGVAFIFARKAILLHQEASPFKDGQD